MAGIDEDSKVVDWKESFCEGFPISKEKIEHLRVCFPGMFFQKNCPICEAETIHAMWMGEAGKVVNGEFEWTPCQTPRCLGCGFFHPEDYPLRAKEV